MTDTQRKDTSIHSVAFLRHKLCIQDVESSSFEKSPRIVRIGQIYSLESGLTKSSLAARQTGECMNGLGRGLVFLSYLEDQGINYQISTNHKHLMGTCIYTYTYIYLYCLLHTHTHTNTHRLIYICMYVFLSQKKFFGRFVSGEGGFGLA